MDFNNFLKKNWINLYRLSSIEVKRFNLKRIDPEVIRNQALKKVVQAKKNKPMDIIDMLARGTMLSYIRKAIKTTASDLCDVQKHDPISSPDSAKGIFEKKKIKPKDKKEAIEVEKYKKDDLTARPSDKNRISQDMLIDEDISNLRDSSGINPEEELENKQNMYILIDLLDEKEFKIAKLHYADRYTSQEIAEELSMNDNSVRTKLREIRLIVKHRMIKKN